MPLLVESVDNKDIELIKRLVDRLEHLSADSSYAHRASGLRGSLLRAIGRIEAGELLNREERTGLEQAVEDGFEILELAAKEVGGSK
ncbi:MAG TPA: hypothetical protein VLD65_03395 [Anaerolineales bacterium]|nr:hypothetical protein [Anaerolineales bacterium]